MAPDVQAKLLKIRQFSIFFRVICKILLALITLAGVGAVVCMASGVGGLNYDNMAFATAELTLGHRMGLALITAIAFAALIKCIYHLHQLFGDYSRGEIFTRRSVGQLRQFGIACLLWGFVNFFWGVSLTLSFHPSRSFQDHADSFFIGIVIIVIAWFMDMAVDLREENELTI